MFEQLQQQTVRDFFSQGRPVYIYSIYPFDRRVELPFSGITEYALPAAKSQTDITCLKVTNAFQLSQIADEHVEKPVFAENIARSLMNLWSQCVLGGEEGLAPGIWLSYSPVPEPEDVRVATEKQTAYFRWLVNQAHDAYLAGRRADITELHRKAALWLGMEDLPWIEEINQKILKECPACFEKIDSRATVCPNCKTPIEATPAKGKKG